MNRQKLRIGLIPFLNLYPIFHELKALNADEYEFVPGFPSVLNRMLRQGEIDISPSSSIEYLRDRGGYTIVPGNSISSRGEIKSILLLSTLPIERLNNKNISLTSQSETSSAMLKIILMERYGLNCNYVTTDKTGTDALGIADAYLAIGDNALALAEKAGLFENPQPSIAELGSREYHLYDIGSLWLEHTASPTVFALWTYSNNLPGHKLDQISAFSKSLDTARDNAIANLEGLAENLDGGVISRENTLAYWRLIEYGLPDDCRRGIEEFYARLNSLKLL